jgi:hypothetical protein
VTSCLRDARSLPLRAAAVSNPPSMTSPLRPPHSITPPPPRHPRLAPPASPRLPSTFSRPNCLTSLSYPPPSSAAARSFNMGLSRFMDLSEAEFEKLHLKYRPTSAKAGPAPSPPLHPQPFVSIPRFLS